MGDPEADKIDILLSFDAVDAGYRARRVLTGLTFDLARGDRLGLVGPNGGGKTTVLRLMLGLLEPTTGHVRRPDRGLAFGYVPQRETLDSVWPLAAEEVVAMAVRDSHRTSGVERRGKAAEALALLGEEGLVGRPFSDLSGGQKQRVLIARALATDPEILILDEPTTGLDLATATGLMALVDRLHAESGVTVVIASHDLNAVANHVERVALVVNGRVSVGTTAAMVTEARLSELYGVQVTVSELDGLRVVLGRDGE